MLVGPGGQLTARLFSWTSGYGVVYEIVPPGPDGGTWTEAILHSFTSQDGQPMAELAIGFARELYGVTGYSATGGGTVFRLTPPGSSGTPWTETILQSFFPVNGYGLFPTAPASPGPNQSLYGTTNFGQLFRLTPPTTKGGTWTEAILYTFAGYQGDGAQPAGALTFDANGNIYGVTKSGGAFGAARCFDCRHPPPAAAVGSDPDSASVAKRRRRPS